LALKALILLLVVVVSSQARIKYDTLSVKHKFYSAAFDTTLRYPIVVRWLVCQKSLTCSARSERTDKFDPDPKLLKWTDLDKDYKGSGYDRGHNMPAYDNGCDSAGQVECFYYSNMAPQTPKLNRGDWKELEDYTRDMVLKYDTVKVWCGSVGATKKIGLVSVPKQCWKVLWIKKIKTYEAYLFDNDGPGTTLQAHRTTTAILTTLTGVKTR
jgi:endonuclease G